MFPSEHPAIDYIPFPGPRKIETPSTEGKQRGKGASARTLSVDFLHMPSHAYQRFQIRTSLGNVSSHLTISAFSLLTLTHSGCWLTPSSDKGVQRETDRWTETDAEPFNEFTQGL